MVKTIERKRLKFKDGYTYLGRNMIMDEHPEYIHKSLLEYFKKEDLHPYPDMWKPYEKLSNYLNVSEEKLLITRGVEGAFKQVFATLVDKGDSVGILTPTCAMYHVYAEVYGIDVIEVKGKKPDYKITVEQIKEIVPNIKVLFLDNPKSHLPSHFTHQELDTIITYCNFFGVKVFLDEVYIGWDIDSYLPKLHKHKNLIISSSFSKIAFASLRVGWLVTNKELKKQIETLRESYELDYFACKLIEFIIDNQDYIKDLKKKILDTKKRWYNELSKSNKFKVYDSKSYVLRLYSKNKELIKKTYDKLYNEKILISIVDDVNLVFSVTNNKKIEEVFFKELSRMVNE
jgi:histidinol-phosphate aminotransferase